MPREKDGDSMKYSKSLAVVLISGLLAAFTEAQQSAAADTEIPLDAKMITLSSGTVEVLDTGGRGVPVLLLHPYNLRLWQYQIPVLSKAGYRVIAIDSRNLAPNAQYDAPGSKPNVARVHELVQQLGLPKFHLIGVLGNGLTAVQYAMAHADELRSVILSNTFGGLRDADLNALELSLRPAPFTQMPQTFRDISASYRAANPEGVKRWLQLDNEGRARGPQAPPANAASAASSAAGTPTAPSAGAGTVTIARLEAWQLPTMMITGDADLYTPPSMMRIFMSHVKKGQGIVIPEAGHNAYWENPEDFNRVVLKFIRKH